MDKCLARRAIGFCEPLVLGLLFVVLSRSAVAQQLPIKTYTTADGLAQNQVNRIVRDSRGYLWFCTAEGLSRFDGYRFTNYTTEHGLPNRSIRDLLETRSGVYWIATGGGLCRFNPQSKDQMFVAYRPRENQWASTTRSVYQDRAGTVWIGTEDGLYRMDEADGEIKFQFIDMGMPAHALVEFILEDRRGTLWLGVRDSGLYRRASDGQVQHITTRNGLPSDRVNAILEDHQGRLWIGTTSGLCLLLSQPGSNTRLFSRPYARKDFGLLSDWVSDVFQSTDERIWVAVSGGLSEVIPAAPGEEPRFRSYGASEGVSHLDLTCLAEDSAGNLWIGATSGAMKFARNGFVTYTAVSDIGQFEVGGIFEARSGELYFVCRATGKKLFLVRYDRPGMSVIRPNFPKHITNFGWGWLQIGLQDREGDWWIPTSQGLCRFPRVPRSEQLVRTRPRAIYTTRNGLSSDDVWRIFEDSRSDLWIVTTTNQTRLNRWERTTGTFHQYTEADGLPAVGGVEAFCEDGAGNILVGWGASLLRYANGRFTVATTTNEISGGGIHALHRDAAGRLWIATDAGGLGRIDDLSSQPVRIRAYTTADGLSSNQVWCITSDKDGRIYPFTGRGVDRLDPANGEVRHFTQHDGLTGGAPKAAFCDSRGALWFGSDLGLSRLLPDFDTPKSPPPILISGLRIAGDQYQLSELGEAKVSEIHLGPNENQLQIDFVALSFGIGEQLKYQYKLEGADADWSVPSDQRSITYARLSPGSYNFLARAVISNGATSQTPATVSFTILPPIWQRWWFVTVAAMLLGLLIYAAYRYKLARVIELERVRTRIAADLHDDIGASLSRMAILSEVVKQQVGGSVQQSVPMLTDIADSARGLVGSMRDIVWAIDPRRDDLANLTSRVRQFASDVLEGRNIKWDFKIPDELNKVKLSPDQRRDVFLFFKEAITNIARHSESNEVWLKMEIVHNQLRSEVRDDGRGFTLPGGPNDLSDGYAGCGLENMAKRISQHRGKFSVQSSPGKGTRLEMTIPLKKS